MAPNPWDDDAQFGFICPHCKRPSVAEVAGFVATRTEFIKPGPSGRGATTSVVERAALVKCSVCGRPVLLEQNRQWEWETTKFLWPPPVREISESVPAAIRETVEEARGCFQHGFYKASVVMVRRALEAVCMDQGSSKKTLAASLAELEAQGKLDGRLTEWAHELRALGNLGAHFTTESVVRLDVVDALAFVEALLDYLYVLSAQFDAFKTRRQAAQQAPSSSSADGVEPGDLTSDPPF